MSIECWCLPVLFLGVCQINHGMVLLCSLQCVLLRVRSVLSFIFASGLFKKSGEKRKILDGLIISLYIVFGFCVSLFSLILFFLLGVAYHLLVSGVLVNGFGGLGGVGYWVVLTILGLFRGLLSLVFSTVQSYFTCCDNSGVYL